ncbi:MAG: peptide chain release factor-like protein [Elusimicrobia bacterium]|nr:peptide chain release factor-like protein [Elusimicrobiota bacterium]
MTVSPEKIAQLKKKFRKLKIREENISEKFIKSQGPGGQKVNKTSTCVFLKHRPSGIAVKCQKSRSQALNRFLARRILAEKIEQKILGAKSAKMKEISKIRRQKRKRSKRAKEKILKLKKIVAEKKKLRAKPILEANDI